MTKLSMKAATSRWYVKPVILLNMKTRNFYFTLALAMATTGLSAQDIHFSQFTMTPLLQNPAMSGAQHNIRVVMNYKNQWQSVASPYSTFAVSTDMKLTKQGNSKGFLAGGIQFFSDRAGDSKLGTTQGNLNIAYHVRTGENSTFGAGLMSGFSQRSISYSELQWGNQFNGSTYDSSMDPRENTGGNSFTFADFGAGLLFNYDNKSGAKHVTDNHDFRAHIGVACFHVNRPHYAFSGSEDERLYVKTVVHGNMLYSIKNTNVAIAPGFMYYRQGPTQEIFAGGMLRYCIQQDSKYTGFKHGAAFSAGGFIRAKDAVVISALMEFANYSLGMSYDINVSDLRTASSSRGGFEISIRYVAPNPFKNTTNRSLL